MKTKEDPRRLRRRGQDENCYQDYSNAPTKPGQSAPLCALHGRRIVTEFPHGCPLGIRNPLDSIGEYQQRAWELMGESNPLAFAMFDCYDTCAECVPRLLRHPHVRRLRGAML